jgi:hypothetical protein
MLQLRGLDVAWGVDLTFFFLGRETLFKLLVSLIRTYSRFAI